MGYTRSKPEELETPQVGGMACAQIRFFLPPVSDAYRVHHRRYVFICWLVRYTTDQLAISIGVAFFDSSWTRSVCPSSLDRKRKFNFSSAMSTVLPV